MSLPQVDLAKLLSLHAQVERIGSEYRYGVKPSPTDSARTVATCGSDCSGYVRWLLAQATDQNLVLPGYSQTQREWCETHGLHRVGGHGNYANVQRYLTNNRLFICFIKPFAYGCGDVGHVWLVANVDGDSTAETIESYGGHGPGSRNWNAGVLVREVYEVFELPTKP